MKSTKFMHQAVRGEKPLTIRVPGLKGGAGDIIAKFTKIVGIRPCSACEKRRQMLNQKLQFK